MTNTTNLIGPVRLACLLLASTLTAEEVDVLTFDDGPEGWAINGSEQVDAVGGNPGPHLHLESQNSFGVVITAQGTDDRVIGNYFEKQITGLGIDIDTVWIGNAGNEFTRHVILELRDYDAPPVPYPWVSVWLDLGLFPSADDGWQSFSAAIPLQEELPAGWGGTGDEDPDTYLPRLPADRTYGSVLRGVDALIFTSYVPGQGYGSNTYEIRVDNISVTTGFPPACPADITGNGLVDGEDLTMLLGEWGACELDCQGDIDENGTVDGSDLTILLGFWGDCPA
jgi:hypothetical protein